MRTLKEAVKKKIIDAFVHPRSKKVDPIFDMFSGPIEFGNRGVKFGTFSGPIPFGKRRKKERLDEVIHGPTKDDLNGSKENDLHARLEKHYDFGKYLDSNKENNSHRATISSYTTNGARFVNNYLHKTYRGKKVDDMAHYGYGVKGSHKEMVKRMDDLVHKHKTPESMVVHSGIPESPHHLIKQQGGYENKKGAHIILPAYTSTSVSRTQAGNFSRYDDKANAELSKQGMKVHKNAKHMLKIYVPKGHHGAYVDHHSGNKGEREFILPRETRLHIHHEPEITHNGKGVVWHAHIVDEKGNRVPDR